jgi:hypothetical protein
MAQATQRRNNHRQEKRNEKPAPVWSRRYWTGKANVEVAVWSNVIEQNGDDREVFSASLKKTYKDGDDYKESGSFFPEELPLVAFALQEAFSFISETLHRE